MNIVPNTHPTLNNGGFINRHLAYQHYIGLCITSNVSPTNGTDVYLDAGVLNGNNLDLTLNDGNVIQIDITNLVTDQLSNLPLFKSDSEALAGGVPLGEWYLLDVGNPYGETDIIIMQNTGKNP